MSASESREARMARLRRIVLCPEAVGIVLVAGLLVVAGDVEDLLGRARAKWLFLIAHGSMLILICAKAGEVMARRTRIGRRHSAQHLDHAV